MPEPARTRPAKTAARLAPRGPEIVLRRFGTLTPRAIVIGASTGGPQALLALLKGLATALQTVPVVIVLHMPRGFTGLISGHLARSTGLPVSDAAHGEILRPGHVYFAAGGVHSAMVRSGDDLVLMQSDAPPVHYCKPAVDVLFRSAAEVCGPGVLGIVLTGMGTDGLSGAAAIVEAGGSVVAQDKATSVVWGMPGAVAQAGLCAAVGAVEELGALVSHRLRLAEPGVYP